MDYALMAVVAFVILILMDYLES